MPGMTLAPPVNTMPEDSTSSKPARRNSFWINSYSSSTRGWMTSASARRLHFRLGRSSTPATSRFSLTSASCDRAQPYLHLMSSASRVGVRRAMAMSLVIWSPAIGITEVWRMAPCVHTAMSVVPPPMSIRQTPRSFSSSDSTAKLEASGCSTRSFTSRPQRRTHLTMFCAAEMAPVTICTFTSRRIPLMPIGSRMPSWPSITNSCVRMCRISCSAGIGMARAVSITRSISPGLTSLSLMATIPLELKLRIWLPAIPVYTSFTLQSAISSTSWMTLEIACTVSSILTTTPRDRPRASCAPTPSTLRRPSDATSATTATILEVPMSRPTISSLLSLLMTCPYGQKEWKWPPTLRDNAQRRLPGNEDQQPSVRPDDCQPIGDTAIRKSPPARRRYSTCAHDRVQGGCRYQGANSMTGGGLALAGGSSDRSARGARYNGHNAPSMRYRYPAGHAAPVDSYPDHRSCYRAPRKHPHRDSTSRKRFVCLRYPSAPRAAAHQYPETDCQIPGDAHRPDRPKAVVRPPGEWLSDPP